MAAKKIRMNLQHIEEDDAEIQPPRKRKKSAPKAKNPRPLFDSDSEDDENLMEMIEQRVIEVCYLWYPRPLYYY